MITKGLRVQRVPFLTKIQHPYNAEIVFRGNSSVVEHNLAKVGVASSSLVSRSSFRENGSFCIGHRMKSAPLLKSVFPF